MFFSRSDGVTDRVVNIDNLAKYFSKDYYTFIVDDFFKTSGLTDMLKEIAKNSLDGVVLAGDSPMNYQTKKSAEYVINQIEARGINTNKIGFANIKEQAALAHPSHPQKATEKAKTLVEVAIEKVKQSHPIKTRDIAPHPAVAIIGATPGAMLTAQRLLERNFKVYIIDKISRHRNFSEDKNQDKIASVITFVEMHPKTRVLYGAKVTDVYGYPGRFNLDVMIKNDLINLTVGSIIIANTTDRDFTEEIRPLLHVDINEEGLFKPLNNDTLLVFTTEKGIFLLPDDESPSLSSIVSISDSVAFAVTSFLEKKEICYKIVISEVDEELCSGCGTCVKTCMFKASKVDPIRKISIIDEQRCKGCGNCVTSCPTGARDLFTYPQKYLSKAIELLAQFGDKGEPKVLAFLCEGCGYTALDLAGLEGIEYNANIMPLGIRCGGNIDTQLILEAYKHGFNGIVICKCSDTNCRNIVGNTDLDRRANLFRDVLRSRGIESDSLRIVEGLSANSNQCVKAVMTLYDDLKNNGGGN